jgi:putative membrane protein
MRPLALVIGALTLATVWVAPFEALLGGPFAAHMTMHMGVVAVAAPLIALGLAGGKLDPVRRAPSLFPPIPASLVELLVVWGWHAPVLHQAARTSDALLVFEQASFLASGLFVWIAALGGKRGPERANRIAMGLVALLLTSMHMTLLGALLALPPRPLYAHGHHAALEPSQLLADQHVGGAIMLIAGGLSYLAGGLWLMLELLREPRMPALSTRASGVRGITTSVAGGDS